MGPIKFLVFYVLGGLAADAAQILDRDRRGGPHDRRLRARSPAVLGGYLLLFPRARVVTVVFIIFFFTILELPAILFLGIWILQQGLFAYFDLLQPDGGGRRGRVLRAHRRVRVRPAGDQAVRQRANGAAGSWSG